MRDGDQALVVLLGDLDVASAPDLAECLDELTSGVVSAVARQRAGTAERKEPSMATGKQKQAARWNLVKAREAQSARAHGNTCPAARKVSPRPRKTGCATAHSRFPTNARNG